MGRCSSLRVSDPRLCGVQGLVIGGAGVGKTTLLARLVGQASASGSPPAGIGPPASASAAAGSVSIKRECIHTTFITTLVSLKLALLAMPVS